MIRNSLFCHRPRVAGWLLETGADAGWNRCWLAWKQAWLEQEHGQSVETIGNGNAPGQVVTLSRLEKLLCLGTLGISWMGPVLWLV